MSEKVVIVETYDNPHEADMAKQMLESEGILVFLENRFIVETDWLLAAAVGNIRLQVPGDQAEKARELLKDLPRWSGLENTEPLDETDLKCMECGQVMGEDEEKCPACGWGYGDAEQGKNAGETDTTDER
jgi:hypothetical protein